MPNLFQIIFHKLWILCTITLVCSLLTFWFCGLYVALITFTFLFSGVLYVAQDSLLYYPNDPSESRYKILLPSQYKLPFESIKIKNKNGDKIHMFLIKHPTEGNHAPTMIFFHGNAGNIGQRLLNVSGLYQHLNINVLLVEYRGYGFSEGIPSEQGFYNDAQLSIDYVMQRSDIDITKIIIFGRSLGGAVAIDLASRLQNKNKVWGLIVENTFTSIPEMARILLKWNWLKWLPKFCYKNKYMSLKKIGHVSTPTLVICGSADTLVPPSMSKALYVRCAAVCKKLVVIPGGGHDDTWASRDYYPAIQKFLSDIPALPAEIGPFFDGAQDTIVNHDMIQTV